MTARIAGHLGGRPVGDDLAEVEHGDPVADLHHQPHVVLDQEHRAAPRPPPADEVGHRLAPRPGSCRRWARRGAGGGAPRPGPGRSRPGAARRRRGCRPAPGPAGQPTRASSASGRLARRPLLRRAEGRKQQARRQRGARRRCCAHHHVVARRRGPGRAGCSGRSGPRPAPPPGGAAARGWAARPAGCGPRSGRRSPEIRLMTEVLPAPFGPMSPCTSPGPHAKLAPSTARTPPKARCTPRRRRSVVTPAPRAPRQRAQRRGQGRPARWAGTGSRPAAPARSPSGAGGPARARPAAPARAAASGSTVRKAAPSTGAQ